MKKNRKHDKSTWWRSKCTGDRRAVIMIQPLCKQINQYLMHHATDSDWKLFSKELHQKILFPFYRKTIMPHIMHFIIWNNDVQSNNMSCFQRSLIKTCYSRAIDQFTVLQFDKQKEMTQNIQPRRWNGYLDLWIAKFSHLKLCLATATHNFGWWELLLFV